MEKETVKIVLVEDDELDAEAVERAFRKQKIANPVIRAKDGVEALELLRGTDARPPLRRPYLVLLDLNLPRMDGIEFLNSLRSDPESPSAPYPARRRSSPSPTGRRGRARESLLLGPTALRAARHTLRRGSASSGRR